MSSTMQRYGDLQSGNGTNHVVIERMLRSLSLQMCLPVVQGL